MDVCKPLRVNYDILGNTDTFLHAHVFPRYEWEEEAKRKAPVWQYPRENWTLDKYQFSENTHGDLKQKLSLKLNALMETYY